MIDLIFKGVGKEEFFNTYYEKKHLIIRRENIKFYDELLNINKIDDLLYSSSNYYPSLKLVSANQERLNPNKYCKNINGGYVIDPDNCIDFFNKGYTLVLSDIQNKLLSLRKLTNSLNNLFNHRTGTNVYITPKGSQGFPSHYDTHDVFVLQISGSKNWRIYSGGGEELPDRNMKFDNNFSKIGNLSEEFTLHTGDLLYIPRGVVHDASCESESSIHITLGLFGKTWADFISSSILNTSKYKAVLRKYPRLESSNFNTLNSDAISDLKNILADVIDNLSSEIKVNDKEMLSNIRSTNLGYFKKSFQLEQIHPNSKIILNKSQPFTYVIENDNLIVSNSKQKLTLPGICKEFIVLIYNLPEPTSISSINDEELDFDSKVIILKQLMKMDVINLE